MPVEFITGGTIDRLNKEKLAKGNPESDITFTTSHVGWLYAEHGLFEKLDLRKFRTPKTSPMKPASVLFISELGLCLYDRLSRRSDQGYQIR